MSKQLEGCNGENQLPEHDTAAYCCPVQLGAMDQAVEISCMSINSLVGKTIILCPPAMRGTHLAWVGVYPIGFQSVSFQE